MHHESRSLFACLSEVLFAAISPKKWDRRAKRNASVCFSLDPFHFLHQPTHFELATSITWRFSKPNIPSTLITQQCTNMFPRVCTAFLIWMMASSSSLAFAPPHVGTHQQSHQCRSGRLQHSMFPNCRQRSILYSTPSEDEGAPPNESITTTTTSNDVKKSEPTEPEGTQYPINLPSPLLLASGMILAIVCTGMFMCCIIMLFVHFELKLELIISRPSLQVPPFS